MKFNDIIRKSMAVIDKTTADLQDTILFSPWIGFDTQGGPAYDSPISIQAVVEEKQYQKIMPNGDIMVQKASILIPRPLKPHGAVDRDEPIDPRDQIVLPSGYTGPILNVNGVTDPKTHFPYGFEVILG